MYKKTLILFILIQPLRISAQEIDPTKPFGIVPSSYTNTEKKGVSAIVLQSIIQSNNIKKAVINGQLLNIGDSYKGFELISINSKNVVLHSPEGEMELSLFSGVIVGSK